jgi:tRNA-specific 2-thiouridylase
MKQEKIFVGLSGGVDSSVAALRLKQRGHSVVGVFIKVWQPDFLECNWERERLDAMRVAAHLDIPFLTFDAGEIYKREVADYMIDEYKKGRTPNPDVMCNKYVKFGAFLDFAKTHGADKVATGHYAQIGEAENGYALIRSKDPEKDQSYFLWTLTQEQLASIYFPIGDSTKACIREEAKKAGLPTFAKRDSQGICFLGQVDIKAFLSHYVDAKKGDVLDGEGKMIGSHEGAVFYTLGQRHGFTFSATSKKTKPHFVVAVDIQRNTITVAEKPQSRKHATLKLEQINVIEDNWNGTIEAVFRYRQKPSEVTVTREENGYGILTVLSAVEDPPRGQSCVLYRNDHCLGGGILA